MIFSKLTSNPKVPEYSLLLLLSILIIVLVTFGIQWYNAWLQIQEVQLKITAE